MPGKVGIVPVAGIASGSATRRYKDEPLGRYRLLGLSGAMGEAHIEMVTRGRWQSRAEPLSELDRRCVASWSLKH